MTVVRQDTFTRANVASGWGTATDGNAWTIQAGNGQSVASNEGKITASTASTFATLGASLPGTDASAIVRWGVETSASTFGIILRWTNSSNWYIARFSGSGTIQFLKKVAGTSTTVGSYTFTASLVTSVPNYWMRFQVQGTTISIRTWLDGSSEPSTWNYTVTDTGLAGSGGSANYVGLYGYGSTNSDLLDRFSVDDLSSGSVALSGTVPSGGSVSGVLLKTDALSGTVPTGGGASGTLSTQLVFAGSIPSGGAVSGTLLVTKALQGNIPSGAAVSGTLFTGNTRGTGIGALTVSTKSQTWTGGSGGASPGTETDVTYLDSTNSGWSVGLIPSYGGMPISSWYEVDGNVTGNNQTALVTSTSDGAIHWLEQLSTGTFGGSEDKAFTLTELAPTGTSFRRYYQCSFGPDSAGFNWVGYACIYPGDPGLIAYRFDCINPSGSAVTLASSDSLEIALVGGLQQTDTTWAYGNGGYGTLAGGNVTPWPVASANGNPVTTSPDYVYIAPANGAATSIGRITALAHQPSALSPAWSSVQLSALVNSSRLKLKVFGTQTVFPASTTSTAYLLWAFRRNLTAADAYAISADYIAPGTPSVSVGSYTAYSYDERAYTFAASGNALTTTLDLSPAHVTVRFKPVLKVTNWTTVALPTLTWGGSPLVANTDYRAYVDTTNTVLYLQLYFDVVSSGAGSGQRNNATLSLVDSTTHLTGTISSGGGASATLLVSKSLVGTVAGASSVTGALTKAVALSGTVGSGGSVSGTLTHPTTLTGVVPSGGAVSGTLTRIVALSGSVPSGGAVSGTLTVTGAGIHLAGTIPSGGGCSASLPIPRNLSAVVASGGGMQGTLTVLTTVALSGLVSGAGGCAGSLSVTKALTGTVGSSGAVSGFLSVGLVSIVGVITVTDFAPATLTITDSSVASCAVADSSTATVLLGDAYGQ